MSEESSHSRLIEICTVNADRKTIGKCRPRQLLYPASVPEIILITSTKVCKMMLKGIGECRLTDMIIY